ncbi:MAG: T9SS type A sorting domain-containing protein [Sphingobacteriaceae bacterium]|nr:T9SS type A sorting domain-containing protein [Sphingobacteriaceae bacterium]
MKKIYSLILLSFVLLNVQAQITITKANHEPLQGDQYGTWQIDSTTVSAGSNTASESWSFAIVTHSSLGQNYTVTASSNTIWPSASVAVSSSTLPGSFYSSTANDLKYWGGNLTLGDISAELRFANAASYMAYPTSLNGGTTSPISGSITTLGQSGTFTGVCTVTALATGTMALPAKTFSNVIRVTTGVVISFTAGGIPGNAQQVVEDFYSLSDSKYPIVTINTSTLSGLGTSVQKYAYVQKNYNTVGIKDNSVQNINLNVFPNPASTQVNFSTPSDLAKQVDIFDLTGKKVESILLQNGKAQLNVSDYNNGLYLFKLTDGGNRSLKSGRITVNH